MNIRPLYDRIVIKRIEEQETTRNGIVIPDSAQEKPQEGEVMAIGNGKRLDDQEAPQRDAARLASEEEATKAKLEKARLANKLKFRP